MPALKYITLSLHAINVMLKDPIARKDSQILQDCCWTLSYITEYNPHSYHTAVSTYYDDVQEDEDGCRLDQNSHNIRTDICSFHQEIVTEMRLKLQRSLSRISVTSFLVKTANINP